MWWSASPSCAPAGSSAARSPTWRPHSGSNANAAVFKALLKPGDTILAMDTAAGGHISHGHPATLTGRDYRIIRYGVDRESERIDMALVLALAREHRPRLVIAGGSAYPRVIDFAGLRHIADEVGAMLMVDMAHIAGLVAAGLHASPFPHAQVVTTTTYKSLRGARGGLVLWNDPALSKPLNLGVFPRVQGSVMLHIVAGKAACLGEALRPEFHAWNAAVLANAAALASALASGGLRLVAGGTDTGLMLVDLRPKGLMGEAAEGARERRASPATRPDPVRPRAGRAGLGPAAVEQCRHDPRLRNSRVPRDRRLDPPRPRRPGRRAGRPGRPGRGAGGGAQPLPALPDLPRPAAGAPRMTLMLASVASLEEADQVLGLGADLIDLKDPSRGALGAWPPDRVREAVGRIAGCRTTSATIGDLPMCPRMWPRPPPPWRQRAWTW